jgi:hypothetical protein
MSQPHIADASSLPKAGSTRRCPNCGAPSMAMKRWPQTTGIWQVSCSSCNHVWQERTTRSFLDALRESRAKVLFLGACLLAPLPFLLALVAYPLGKFLELGRPGSVALGVLFLLAFAFLVGAAYAWRHSISTGPDTTE